MCFGRVGAEELTLLHQKVTDRSEPEERPLWRLAYGQAVPAEFRRQPSGWTPEADMAAGPPGDQQAILAVHRLESGENFGADALAPAQCPEALPQAGVESAAIGGQQVLARSRLRTLMIGSGT
jgi:hypothetical protein